MLLVSKIVVQGNIDKLFRSRKKEENEESHLWYLLIAFSCEMQIQHWNTRMTRMIFRYSIGSLISQGDS